jgi:hypothetical protein
MFTGIWQVHRRVNKHTDVSASAHTTTTCAGMHRGDNNDDDMCAGMHGDNDDNDACAGMHRDNNNNDACAEMHRDNNDDACAGSQRDKEEEDACAGCTEMTRAMRVTHVGNDDTCAGLHRDDGEDCPPPLHHVANTHHHVN